MGNPDKVFKAYDIRGLYPRDIDEDLAWKVGYAAGQFLRTHLSGFDRGQASANRVVVGRDIRPHSPTLAAKLIEGILNSGLSVVDVGLIDTPMVYFAVNHLGACGGIQVTASHNPVEYNGFKICGQKAKPVGESTGLKEIHHLVSGMRVMQQSGTGTTMVTMDLWEAYRKHVLSFLHLGRRIKVAVDASNGCAGKMFPAVFDNVGIDVVPLNFEIGKGFAHAPNPLIEANLAQVRAAVMESKADFGICFDGDADRCMFVDEQGNIIRSDYMTALLAKHFLKIDPGAAVIYDLRSSHIVPEVIKAAGGVPKRERVGHAFIKKTMADTRAVVGGELSGHFYFRDNFNADSGAIVFAVAASMISSQDKPVSRLIAPLDKYSQSGEKNFRVLDKNAKVDELLARYADGKIDNLDGITVEYPTWWFNVRASNTEPLLRLNLEADTPELAKAKLAEVEGILGQPVEE